MKYSTSKLRLEASFRELGDVLPDSRVRDRLVLFSEIPPETPLREAVRRLGSSGSVVETVPLALFLAGRNGKLPANLLVSND